jgi:hypothetical protein
MVLSALFGFSRKRSARDQADAPDRRGEERYEAYHPVSVSLPGPLPPVAGTVINLSLSGAAVRIPGWAARAPAEWLTRLDRGDELRLAGLVEVSVSCLVIAVDGGVLRVRFSGDEAMRGRLREVIDSLAPL